MKPFRITFLLKNKNNYQMFIWFKRSIFLFVLLISLVACSSLNLQTEQLGYAIDLRSGEKLTATELAHRLATQKRVLLGELHDSPRHHQAQHWLLKQFISKRPQGSLALEMLAVNQQPLIDRIYAKSAVKKSEIYDLLQWKKSWNWDFYGDIVYHAFNTPYSLVATNLTNDEVQTILRGAVPLKGYVSTTPEVKKQIADLIANHHCADCIDVKYLQAMVEVQQFRDRRMAEKILQASTPALLIAGNHHVNRAFGVPLHLFDLSQQETATVVIVTDSVADFTQRNADYLWIIQE